MAGGETSYLGGARPFPETSWSVIERCREDQTAERRAGLERLFRSYWGPVYLYIRRNFAKEVDEAKDLAQAFFLALIEKEFLESVDADKGRFRSFVCAALRHFLLKQERAARAEKRRPKAGPLLSIDQMQEAGAMFEAAAPAAEDRERQFDDDWKRAAIEAVLERLRALAGGKESKAQFVALFEQYDLGPEAEKKPTYRELAQETGLPVHQVTNGLRWARQTFKELFVEELREQTRSDTDLAAEAWEIFGIKV